MKFTGNQTVVRVLWGLMLGALASCNQVQDTTNVSGQIHVSTDPSGATLICDGITYDLTPTTILKAPPGNHLVIVKKTNYQEARRTVALQSDQRIAIEIKLEPMLGLVLIHSNPAGADIEIDTGSRGKTPLLITDFPFGKHRIRGIAAGFQPKSIDVMIADRTPQKIILNLVSDSAKLVIETIPPGAQVSLDGVVLGKSPCTAPRITAGKHRVEIALQGYAPHQDEIIVQAGDERKVSVSMKSLPAKLSVVSVPSAARVYLNDQFKGEAPVVLDALQPGKYAIRAELRGFETQIRTNDIRSGEESTLEFAMAKNSGILMLSTEPPGASIFLDGENRGTTLARGNEPRSAPFQIDLLMQGQHKLQLTRQGYCDLARTIEITTNQTLMLNEKLKPRPVPFVPNVLIRTGRDRDHEFRGIIRERFSNGDIKCEIEPGIFRTFKPTEIIAIENLPQEQK